MKKRTKITPFAKIVIAGIIFLGARYLYLNRDRIASGDLFNLNDTTKVVKENRDTTSAKDTFAVITDTLKSISKDSIEIAEDTLTISVEKTEDLLILKSKDFSINILLNDSVQVSDTIFFKLSDDKNIVGRIIIK
ncbi:MAG: hypothetical protein K8R54_05055 [Bacteroidales bacterium]|nr:hypothetical protein [Bacteroidales bacterium]